MGMVEFRVIMDFRDFGITGDAFDRTFHGTGGGGEWGYYARSSEYSRLDEKSRDETLLRAAQLGTSPMSMHLLYCRDWARELKGEDQCVLNRDIAALVNHSLGVVWCGEEEVSNIYNNTLVSNTNQAHIYDRAFLATIAMNKILTGGLTDQSVHFLAHMEERYPDIGCSASDFLMNAGTPALVQIARDPSLLRDGKYGGHYRSIARSILYAIPMLRGELLQATEDFYREYLAKSGINSQCRTRAEENLARVQECFALPATLSRGPMMLKIIEFFLDRLSADETQAMGDHVDLDLVVLSCLQNLCSYETTVSFLNSTIRRYIPFSDSSEFMQVPVFLWTITLWTQLLTGKSPKEIRRKGS